MMPVQVSRMGLISARRWLCLLSRPQGGAMSTSLLSAIGTMIMLEERCLSSNSSMSAP